MTTGFFGKIFGESVQPTSEKPPSAPSTPAGASALPSTVTFGKLQKEFDLEKSSLDVRTIHNPKQEEVGLKDFTLLKVIGRGSFGKVMQVRKIDTGEILAMKTLQKKRVVKKKRVEHTQAERNILVDVKNPFVVTLHYAFQTESKLYLIMDFHAGGDLFFHLARDGAFPEDRVRFYAAELVIAIEGLHEKDVIYRDLKAENVLLTADGHICLTDFGLAKEDVGDLEVAFSYCGTLPYMAPEIVTRQGHGKAVDWWSLGVLLNEMATGKHPFYDEDDNVCRANILERTVAFPSTLPPNLVDLLQILLTRDMSKRLAGIRSIRSHPFFAGVDWTAMHNKAVPPPFVPPAVDNDVLPNFDAELLEQIPTDSPSNWDGQFNFANFSYIRNNPPVRPDNDPETLPEDPHPEGVPIPTRGRARSNLPGEIFAFSL